MKRLQFLFTQNKYAYFGAIFVFFYFIVFATHYGEFHLPYHWDEILVYYYPLHDLLTRGFFTSITDPGVYFFHPPGMQLLAWPVYSIFGDVPFAGRIFASFSTAIVLFFTYLMGEESRGKLFGFCAALFLYFTPRFFPQSLQFHADLTLMALASAYIFFALKGKHNWAVFCGLWCGLTRESGIGFGVALALYFLFFVKPIMENIGQKIMVVIAPFVSLGSVYLFHKILVGKFLNHQAIVGGDIRFLEVPIIESLQGVLSRFITNWTTFLQASSDHWELEYWLLVLCVGIFFLRLFRAAQKKEIVSLDAVALISCFIFTAFFTFNRGFLERYMAPVYPFFALFLLGQIWNLTYRYALFFVLVAILTNSQRYHEAYRPIFINGLPGNAFVTTMDHVPMIKMHKKMGEYLDDSIPEGATFVSGWPLTPMFFQPFYGYVNRKFQEVNLSGNKAPSDYMLLASCLPTPLSEQLQPYIKFYVKLKEFREPGMWIALYKKK